MTKNLKWRLTKLPSVEELQLLVKDKIISQEEARSILFNEIEDDQRDSESLKEEIKFLRELVSKLSSRSTIVEQIRYIEKPYYNYGWYQPYVTYCSNTATLSGGATAGLTSANYLMTSVTSASNDLNTQTLTSYVYDGSDFSQISTF